MANDIVIDEQVLQRLDGKYTNLHDDVERARRSYQFGNRRGDLSQPLKVPAGNAGWAPADGMQSSVDGLRQGLTERFTSLAGGLFRLEWGVRFTLQHTDGTEQLNSMTAQEWSSHVPAAPGATGAAVPPAAPSGV